MPRLRCQDGPRCLDVRHAVRPAQRRVLRAPTSRIPLRPPRSIGRLHNTRVARHADYMPSARFRRCDVLRPSVAVRAMPARVRRRRGACMDLSLRLRRPPLGVSFRSRGVLMCSRDRLRLRCDPSVGVVLDFPVSDQIAFRPRICTIRCPTHVP